MVEISGITWNHTRGLLPMVATGQRFSELNPNVVITWKKRSLQEFADAPLSTLAEQFDLLVIDHPSIGDAAEKELLVPLDDFLPCSFLADLATHSVGKSHPAYNIGGKQYALAIDAATPVSGWRQDLLDRAETKIPKTWEDLLVLARRGLMVLPATAIDSLMNFLMLINALGIEAFSEAGIVVPHAEGTQALELLRELVGLSAPGSLQRNPISTWQYLAESDDAAFCPFAYGYSNYSRRGYAAHLVQTGGLISLGKKKLRSTLGGAGLAISRRCKHLEPALAYAAFVASSATQSTLYTQAGGQPGHRAAWLDAELNVATNGFFANTLQTLDEAWVRPRFAGYIEFQDRASHLIHEYLGQVGSPATTLNAMNEALQAVQ